MNTAERIAPSGLQVSEIGAFYVITVPAETEGAAIIEGYRAASALGYVATGTCQVVQQESGAFRVELQLKRDSLAFAEGRWAENELRYAHGDR